MSDYLTCRCGQTFRADYVQDFPDRTVKLGRCPHCHAEAAHTTPRRAA